MLLGTYPLNPTTGKPQRLRRIYAGREFDLMCEVRRQWPGVETYHAQGRAEAREIVQGKRQGQLLYFTFLAQANGDNDDE